MELAYSVRPRLKSQNTSGNGITAIMKASHHLRSVRSELKRESRGLGTSGRTVVQAESEYKPDLSYPILLYGYATIFSNLTLLSGALKT